MPQTRSREDASTSTRLPVPSRKFRSSGCWLGVSHTEDEETTVDAIRVHLANLSHHETAASKD